MGAIIVDRHPCVRMALTALMTTRTEIPVLADVDHDQEIEGMTMTESTLVISGLSLSGPHPGAAFLRRLTAGARRPRVLVFSAADDQTEVMAALSLGADSFVHKSTSCTDLVNAIERTYDGERVWLFDRSSWCPPTPGGRMPTQPSLTHRENQVLSLLLRRFSNEEIAEELGLARQTVKNHVSSVFRKFGVRTRRELLRSPEAAAPATAPLTVG
ncbi:LuxR C-terminal-related transcriptional regulator [Streptomyces sp. NPDC059853]|uniref:LuxR C-terminal-related transcriptional regulator n=1 Tax=Streptomyces sp. NPDC059853 TaxID=3346973 RepID=UPI003667CC12